MSVEEAAGRTRGARSTTIEWLCVAALVVAALVVAWVSGGLHHDYESYLDQFAAAIRLGNPWAREMDGVAIDFNAYGPLHALIGFGTPIHTLFAKMVFACCGIATFLLMVTAAGHPMPQALRPRIGRALVFLLSPLVAIAIFVFGDNDSVVALALCAACVFRHRGNHAAAGVALAIGALMKFYPILLVGFFALDREGRLRLRTIAAAGVAFVAGMAIAYAAWGTHVFEPLAFGAEREPSMLSPLMAIHWIDWPLPVGAVLKRAIRHNGLLVAAVAGVFSLHAWRARLDYRIAAVVGMMLILFTYKVGHLQFYLGWMAIYAWLIVTGNDEIRPAIRAFVPLAVFLSLYQLLFWRSEYIGDSPLEQVAWTQVLRWGTVPYSLTVLWCLVASRKCWLRPWRGDWRPAW